MNIKTNFEDLSNAVEALFDQVYNVTGKSLAEMGDEDGTLGGEIDRVRREMSYLEDDVADAVDLEQKVTDLEEELDDMKKDLYEAESRADSLAYEVDELQEEVDSLREV